MSTASTAALAHQELNSLRNAEMDRLHDALMAMASEGYVGTGEAEQEVVPGRCGCGSAARPRAAIACECR